MRLPRPIVPALSATALAVVVLAGGAAFAADSIAASRVEADLSLRIRPATPGVAAPAVVVGGGPTGRWSGDDRLTSVSVRADGVERPGLGPVTVEATATDVILPADHSAPLSAASTAVSVLLTGEVLGRALGLQDVRVGAAQDSSLAGGVEHTARVEGTVERTNTRISTFVDLVVDARGAHLVPVAASTGPAGGADQDAGLALSRTALTLAADVLPLGLEVETFTVRGGTLTASGRGGPGTAPLDGLA